MNKPLRRVISAALALSLSVTLAVNAYAEEIEKVHKPEAASSGAVAVMENSEKAKKPEKIKITKDNLPEVLDFERVKGQGFVSRLKSEEQDMCEIILENEDGTRGLYVFDSPVKFKNKNGETVDKSNKVKPHTKNGAPCFKSESNDIEVHLPATIQGGVSLKDEEVNVSMKPIPSVASKRMLSVGKQKDEDSVIYEDVFDNYTDIVYTFTYDGVKEDIVLEKYNGKNTFDFEVITGGLSLEEEKGALLLKDENGEVKATMGEIVIFSADNKNNTFGEYKITEKQKNNSYIITVCVDVAYLTSPDTKYPVTIDPTAEIIGSTGIKDMQVFKGADGTGNTETSAGNSGVSRVGWTDWGACRTLMRFTTLNLEDAGIKYATQIEEAYIGLRDLMCQGGTYLSVVCSQFTGNSWKESETRTWNSLNAGKSGVSSPVVNVTYNNGAKNTPMHWYKWDITKIAKKWVGNTDCQQKGVVFRTVVSMFEDSSTYAQYMKTFSSMQGNPNYKPYFYISYTKLDFSPSKIGLDTADEEGAVYWIRKKGTNSYLSANGWLNKSNVGVENHTVNFTNYDSISNIQKMNLYWKLVYKESNDGGYYAIISLHSPDTYVDVISSLNNNGENVGLYKLSSPPTSSSWRIEKKGTSNGINYYTILSKLSDYKKGLNVTGANVNIYDFSAKSNYWEFIKVKCPFDYDSSADDYAVGHALESYEDQSGFYRNKCKVCGSIFLSPEEQDISILSEQEYITVIALQRAYIVEMVKGYNKKAESLLRIINHIRRKCGNSNGVSRYDFRNRKGKFVEKNKYEFDSYDNFYVSVHINDISKSEKAKPFNSFLITAASAIPSPLGLFFSVCSTVAETIEGEDLPISDWISIAVNTSDYTLKAISAKFKIKIFDKYMGIITDIDTGWNSATSIEKIKMDEVKQYDNMFYFSVDIYENDLTTHFGGTYYFNAKDNIKIQSEEIDDKTDDETDKRKINENAHYNFGKFTYNALSNNNASAFWRDLITGEFVKGGGL